MLESYHLSTQCLNSLSSIILGRRKERTGDGCTQALIRRCQTSHTLRSTREGRDSPRGRTGSVAVELRRREWPVRSSSCCCESRKILFRDLQPGASYLGPFHETLNATHPFGEVHDLAELRKVRLDFSMFAS